MCGIAGFAGSGERGHLERMTTALTHRGPDDSGLWCEEKTGVYLGHRRLSIIDLAGGHQPMWTADGQLGIVFNGEIYNYADLREELTKLGHRFHTDHSDTEVLLIAYREWGEEMTSRLNGMWAFVIYDRAARRLFASRDRFGKKPFYYCHKGGDFIFASELRAMDHHPAVPRSLSILALKKYFAYGYIPSPHSIYEGVRKLPAGCSLTFELDSRRLKVRPYWDFVIEPFEENPENCEDAWAEELRHLLEKSVQRRLMSDVPLGIFLSGGIDSSAIAAFAAKHVPQGELNTFSIGFTEAGFDESEHALKIARKLRTHHRAETLDLDKARELLPGIVARLDEPMGDSSLLPTYLLSQITRKHVTVALGGDGGDELFAGYDPFRALKRAGLYSKLVPKPVHMGIRMAAGWIPVSHTNISLDFKIKRTLRGLSYPWNVRCPVWMGPLDPKEIRGLFQEKTPLEELYSEAIEAWDGCRQSNLVDRTMQFYVKLYLQDDILTKVDRASMMNSLEARSPFLDIDFVNFVRRIPNTYKYRNGTTKYILKKALEPVLPKSILHRSKKGFGIPIGRWLNDHPGFFFGEDSPSSLPMLHPAFIENKRAAHATGKNDERAFLWNYWLLSEWMK